MATEDQLRAYLKRVTTDLHRARTRLREVEAESSEPIAVIGMACRFPGGADDPDRLWRLLTSGTDAITPFPADRGWDGGGRGYFPPGGFINDAGGFDAGFFGISPREAVAMDPQQRWLLSTAWEAVEDAGIAPKALRGSRAGVFIGASSSEYGPDAGTLDEDSLGYLLTGTTGSVISGRVAFTLGLEGPAVTVDTACSSSLVALHQAAQSLRAGECSLALSGGVAVMATPGIFAEFGSQGGLSSDGRCKSFSGDADGTGWGEGAGVLVLERLSEARRNGRRVLAVLRGSAVNQDGASNGLTAPNGPSQQRVIRAALANAKLGVADVDAVEAHGTGTGLGDPIEAQALLATYGQDRERPLQLGSIKSNIGHAQAAAGIAGVLKMIQALRHGALPRTLHVREPTAAVDWTAGSVELLTEARDWPEVDRPRRAAVSSFGISGTNAHVILEQAEEPEPVEPDGAPEVMPWVLSAASAQALRDLAARMSAVEAEPAAVGSALAGTRSVFEHRAVLLDDHGAALAALTGDRPAPGLVTAVAEAAAKPVFVFPGQGAQWPGMGVELLGSSPVFAHRMAECAEALREFVDWDLREVLADPAALDRVDVVQPACWAVMVSLAALWESCGVTPAAVIGHSQGEIAAAVVAGALSLADGARVVALRSKVIAESLSGRGGMLSVALPEHQVRERIASCPSVGVAAINGPESVVLSGADQAIDELLAEWEAAGIRVRRVPVDYASHSEQVADVADELRRVLAPVAPVAARIPLISTVTGAALDTTEMDAGYWYRNLRQTVLFDAAVSTVDGSAFVEVSPHPVVVPQLATGLAVATLRRDQGDLARFARSLAEAFCLGVTVDWSRWYGGTTAPRVDLPTYPFQRTRHWWTPGRPAAAGADSRFWELVARGELDELTGVDQDALAAIAPALTRWREQELAETTTGSWRYAVTWTPVPDQPRPELTGRWLVVAPDGLPQTEPVAAALRAAGADVHVTTDVPGSADDAGDLPIVGVLSLLALGDDAAARTLRLVQAGLDAPIWAVTSGAVRAGDDQRLTAPEQAMIWGFGRIAGLEHPKRWGGLIDLADTGEAALDRLVGVLGQRAEDQVAVRDTGLFARRLTRATTARGSRWVPTGTAVVTGGTGALGSRVARWLVELGARSVLVLSRSGPDAPGAAELAADLGDAGRIIACDITDRDALAAALAEAPAHLPVRSVFHAAAVLDDSVVDALRPEQLAHARAAKVDAAVHLHELTSELDAFVLFSSVAGVLGASGQANYAPGNAFLDAFAEHRRGLGLPATAVAWGPWGDGGMAATGIGEIARRHGIPELDPDLALGVLGGILGRDETTAVVADVRWERFATAYTASRPSAFLADLPEARAAVPVVPATGLAALPADQLAERITEVVRDQVAVVLGHSSGAEVAPRKRFKNLGFDSVTAVELRNALHRATGLTLPATLVFDYPTPAALSGHLLERLTGDAAPTGGPAPAGEVDAGGEIAIVGMACRFPGSVDAPEDLWRLLRDEVDAIGAAPTDRGWPATAVRGGFLDGATEFDAGFFGISPREALAMDPQQRLLLETSWEALERAGIDPASVGGTATGVYAGTSGQDYTDLLDHVPDDLAGYVGTGTTASVLSGRVAYVLGTEGPAVTVDTACSSSLVALHLAVQALRRGECGTALAGGVSVMSTPGVFGEFTAQGALSPDGRCKAFGADADGTGFAEGVGVLVLQRLADARAEGRRVLAVVKGSAINSDGASNGLTAPNGPSQQRVIRAALADAGLEPSDVDVVEAHGTGTALGDPIEAQALLATYGGPRPHPLRLGSIKSNIGHTQAAAGVAGVIKAVLALRHAAVPATLHADRPSSEVDWSPGTIELTTRTTPWSELDRPRRAAVSSFGISGTNAHLVLEQAPEIPAEPVTAHRGPVPWVLSAKTATGLRAQADRLAAATGPATDLAAVGWSLLRTRTRFDHRAVVVGDDVDALRAGLAEVEPGAAARDGAQAVFVFPGQGAQWAGMGAELVAQSPVFAERMRECAAALDPFIDWELLPALEDEEALRRVDVVQPASWAVMVSLAELWRSFGVEPAEVIGHSQGEIAAAVVAGALTVEDGARVVALRSQAIARGLAGGGGMASLALAVDQARELIAGRDLSLAAVNGPRSVVVSGDTDELDDVLERCEQAGVRARLIPVDYASHSAQVESLRAELLDSLAPVAPRAPRIPVRSTVTGDVITGPDMDAEYWVANLRGTVLFRHAVDAVEGDPVFIEVGPHPVLSAAVSDALAADDREDVRTVGTLRRDDGGLDRFLRSAGEAHACGIDVDWASCFDEARTVELPTYAWQRQRYWLDPDPVATRERDGEFWSLVDGGGLATELGLPEEEVAPVLPALRDWHRSRRQSAEAESWRYHDEWTPVDADGGARGGWLVLSTEAEPARECAAALLAGSEVDDVRTEVVDDGTDLDALLAGALDGVLLLPAAPDPRRAAELVLAVTRGLAANGSTARLWCATEGAVAAAPDEYLDRPEQAAAWGLGRVAALEHPDLWGGLLDLAPGFDPAALRAVLGGTEDQVAIRGATVLARRLVRAAAEPDADWAPRGTVLVTGGTGALAGHVTRWLAAAGAERIVLLSRGGPEAPGAAELLADVPAAEAVACDVTDRAALGEVLDSLPELTAVVHTAAVLDDGVLAEQTADRLRTVFGPKAVGARLLHELTADRELDAFVLFSSIAGALGNAGQGGYAAANAYVDALAAHRRGRGLPATSVAWGLWGGPSRASDAGDRLERGGVLAMDPGAAVRALRTAVGAAEPVCLVAHVDWPGMADGFTASRPSPLLAALPELRARTESATGGFAAEIAGLAAPQRDRAALALVRKHVAAVLGHADAGSVERDKPFKELGFDSLTAVDLRNRLAAATGLRLATTLVFDRPTPRELAADLLGRLRSPVAADPADPDALLGELERVLAAADDGARAELADRLRALLEPGPADPAAAPRLDAASDDEMFAFIGKELGIS